MVDAARGFHSIGMPEDPHALALALLRAVVPQAPSLLAALTARVPLRPRSRAPSVVELAFLASFAVRKPPRPDRPSAPRRDRACTLRTRQAVARVRGRLARAAREAEQHDARGDDAHRQHHASPGRERHRRAAGRSAAYVGKGAAYVVKRAAYVGGLAAYVRTSAACVLKSAVCARRRAACASTSGTCGRTSAVHARASRRLHFRLAPPVAIVLRPGAAGKRSAARRAVGPACQASLARSRAGRR